MTLEYVNILHDYKTKLRKIMKKLPEAIKQLSNLILYLVDNLNIQKVQQMNLNENNIVIVYPYVIYFEIR